MLVLRFFALFASLAVARGVEVPAFPGAEGYGAWATGGRGGQIVEVTNLDDAGPGSLRAVLEATGPRIVVFRISGIIDLKKRLRVRNGDLTVAGQTAPGDGICLKNFGLDLSDSRNVIIRYLRVRPGDSAGGENDAIGGRDCEKFIVDHCSVSWANDEVMSIYGCRNVTVQWCIVSESLYQSVHHKGVHGYGGIWGGLDSTWHHNLLAHHTSRNPRFARDLVNTDFRNNVIYNWGFNSAYGGERSATNIVGNFFKPGPATQKNVRERILDARSEGGRWFVEDNVVSGAEDLDADNWQGGIQLPWGDEAALRVSTSFPAAFVTTQPAAQAFDSVLENAGAVLPRRDRVDARIVEEARTGTAKFGASYHGGGNGIIDTPTDVGGWPELHSASAPDDLDHDGMPDEWERKNGFNPGDAADGSLDHDGDGYTNVEEFLNNTDPKRAGDYTLAKMLPSQTVTPAQPARFTRPERFDKVVVLTFDDSAVTHATFVAPLLKKYGFGATFFVCEFPPDFDDKTKYMSWAQIRALDEMGFEIGSHTRTHKHVDKMKAAEFVAELGYIEQKCESLGIAKPKSFAYPAYVSTPDAVKVLREKGYEVARVGGSRAYDPTTDDPLLIPSFSTTGDDPERVFKAIRQARDGKIVVLTIHGVPDYAHPNVTTPPELFERYLQFLRDGHYTVIAMQDLAHYMPARSEEKKSGAVSPSGRP